jgi:hypothetical protein
VSTGGRVHWLLHPAVSIVLPAAKLPANAGMVRVPSRAARPLPHPSLGQLAIRLQTQRVGRRPRPGGEPEGERGGERGGPVRDNGPMRAGVSGSWSHQARDGPLFCGDGGRAPKLGADAELLQAWWWRTAAERAATDCVAADPSAARAHALLRWARPFRGAQLPEACSLACAAFEYELRRSG